MAHVVSRRPKTPTEERGEGRVSEVLSAADHLFATTGYEATTMSGIASLAGASIGSLYQFFPNKESIGAALLGRYMDEVVVLLERWKTALPDTPRAFGQGLITIVYDYVSKHPACGVLAEAQSLVPALASNNVMTLSASVLD